MNYIKTRHTARTVIVAAIAFLACAVIAMIISLCGITANAATTYNKEDYVFGINGSNAEEQGQALGNCIKDKFPSKKNVTYAYVYDADKTGSENELKAVITAANTYLAQSSYNLAPYLSYATGLRSDRTPQQNLSSIDQLVDNSAGGDLPNIIICCDESVADAYFTQSKLYKYFYIASESGPIELPEDPEKEGHTFAGWYYGTQDEHGDNCVAYKNEPITAETTLHAHWNINRYTVTYDVNGGVAIENVTVDWNTAAPVPEPTRTGYNFVGWFMTDGVQYNGEAVKADMTLTARWDIKIFTLTFIVDGEPYKTMQVPYGTILVDAMETADIASYRALDTEGVRVSKQSVITENTQVLVHELTREEKFGDFLSRNFWLVWLNVAVLCALLLTATVSIVVAVKRR